MGRLCSCCCFIFRENGNRADHGVTPNKTIRLRGKNLVEKFGVSWDARRRVWIPTADERVKTQTCALPSSAITVFREIRTGRFHWICIRVLLWHIRIRLISVYLLRICASGIYAGPTFQNQRFSTESIFLDHRVIFYFKGLKDRARCTWEQPPEHECSFIPYRSILSL